MEIIHKIYELLHGNPSREQTQCWGFIEGFSQDSAKFLVNIAKDNWKRIIFFEIWFYCDFLPVASIPPSGKSPPPLRTAFGSLDSYKAMNSIVIDSESLDQFLSRSNFFQKLLWATFTVFFVLFDSNDCTKIRSF